VTVIVSCNTADVHFDVIVTQRLQLGFTACTRIIYLNGHVTFLGSYKGAKAQNLKGSEL